MFRIEAKQLNLCFIRPDDLVCHRTLRCFFCSPSGLSCVFHWRASVWPLCPKAQTSRELQWWLSFWKFSPISKKDLWSSARVIIGFLVTSLNKVLLSQLLSLAGWPALGRVLVVPNFFHLRIMECSWEPSSRIICFVAFPRSVPWHNPVSKLCRQFLRPHSLVLLWYALSAVRSYINMCVPCKCKWTAFI